MMRKQDLDHLTFCVFNKERKFLTVVLRNPFVLTYFLRKSNRRRGHRHQTELNIKGQSTDGKSERSFVLVEHVLWGLSKP